MVLVRDGLRVKVGRDLGLGTLVSGSGWHFRPDEVVVLEAAHRTLLSQRFRDSFFRKTTPEPNTGCLLWTAGVDRDGYGKIGVGPQNRRTAKRANRVAWELVHGPIPEGMQLLHGCDNPLCVSLEPGHLYLGTHQQNMLDKRRRWRGSGSRRAFLGGVVGRRVPRPGPRPPDSAFA